MVSIEAVEQIKRFEEFIQQYAYPLLLKNVSAGIQSLIIDGGELAKFDPELADNLLDDPEEVIKAAEMAVLELDLPSKPKDFKVRFKNLPATQKILVRDIRSKHVGRFLSVDGIVRQKSDVRPQVTSARFECPSCGNIISVLQLDTKFKDPNRCGCGRKGKFHLLSKEMVDAQRIVLEESPDAIEGGDQPKRMDIFLKHDLVSPLTDRRTNPGTKILVNGVVKEVPITLKEGGQSIRFDLLIEANYVHPIDEDVLEIGITPEEEAKIKELAADPNVYEKLSFSLAPSIYGHDRTKEAIIAQLVGGCQKKRADGTRTRGDLHILLIGDPGAGKSMLLKRSQVVAPKSRYVTGKGATGAGLTAAVVRDEFLKGWALEAGALVLANNGFVMIDELDKMSKEDRSAMHEALEQQCYSRDLEILFADGSKKPIGDFVDELMEKNQEKIKKGINCEILDAETDVKILTTDFNTISPTLIKSVSRHAAPETMVKITLANGRILQVTPEHPCWVVHDGKITTIPAQMMRKGEYFPLPSELPIRGATQKFSDTPLKNGPALCSLLGYHITDGCYELNRGKKNGIQFWNNDKILIDDYCNAAEKVFGKKPSIVMRGKQFSARLVSKEVASSMRALDKNLMEKGKQKTIPDQIMQCKTDDVALLLRALFDGDGTAVNVPRNGCRVSLVTENRKLADQVTELLLRFGILSSIYNDRAFFKVDVTGHDNLLRFYQKIGFLSRKKQERLREYLKKKKTYRSVSDVVPHTSLKIRTIFRQLALSQEKEVGQIGVEHEKHRVMLQKMVKIAEEKKGILLMEREKARQTIQAGVLGNIRRRANLSLLSMAKKNGISVYLLGQKEKKNEPFGTYQKTILGKIDSMLSCLPDVEELKKLAYGKVRWSKVKMIEIVKNTTGSLVYDVAIEPTHSFISNNMVLHNSVSISKANIQATLRCETTVLAAANPKFGRFDPYELIAKQIDLPPTLINRFDLIFPIKDLPDQKNDAKMASFILTLHKEGIREDVEIGTDLLRKFIAYTRRNIHPQLTDEAIEEIKEYYVSMRNSGQDEGGVRTIPITARQLEALVRLAEASAKVRLSQTVSREDAKRSISLVDYCLRQIGLDKETGKIDIDRISSGITASQRNRIVIIKEIISELEKKLGKTIAVEEIIHEAEAKGIPAEQVDEVIEKLKRAGDVFEPKKGFVTRI